MASSPKAPAVDPIDARLVRRLADILTETGLSEIEVEHSGLKIRVAKTLTAAPSLLSKRLAKDGSPKSPAALRDSDTTRSFCRLVLIKLLPRSTLKPRIGSAIEQMLF